MANDVEIFYMPICHLYILSVLCFFLFFSPHFLTELFVIFPPSDLINQFIYLF